MSSGVRRVSSYTHVDDTHDDGHFHLVRVGKDQRIIRAMPVGVETEWVDFASGLRSDQSFIVGPLPAGLPNVERFGENVIVHEPSVDGKETHENDNVSSTAGWHSHDSNSLEEDFDNLVHARLGELLFIHDHRHGSAKGQDTVTDITKHDGEQERECDDGK